MQQIFIKDLSKYTGQEVKLKGWLYNKRSSGPIAFLELRDGTGFTQAVAAKEGLLENVWEEIEKSGQESSVEVIGTVTEHPKKKGVFELQTTGYKLLSNSVDYPISKKSMGRIF